MTTVAAIAIGRNEGDRLRRCLTSLQSQTDRIVYVDSGSTDGSIAFARGLGCTVVTLDTTTPFTAARARNAGFDALRPTGLPDLVQFVDGDCGLAPGWLAAASDYLGRHPDTALVTGWRSEIAPQASVYNAMCDHEWHRPEGVITACGGDMMVRATAFDAIGGFNPAVIAAEDDEFCLRLGQAGHALVRLPLPMTQHDAAITRFSQWWRRAIRAGHGFAQVGRMHPPHFARERQRVWLFGGLLPALALLGLFTSLWLTFAALAATALSYLRTLRGLMRDGLPPRTAAHHAAYLALSKIPNLIGMLTYALRHARGRDARIIEYK